MESCRGALLLLLLLRGVRALYILDAPAAGYIRDMNQPQAAPPHKMYYVAGNHHNMKLVNERAVDSYFRILRASPQRAQSAPPAIPARARSPPPRAPLLRTEPPDAHQKRPDERVASPRNDQENDQYRDIARTTSGGQITVIKDEELVKPSRKEYFRKHSVYEKNTVVGNDRNARRPHRAQNFHQKMYLSQARDETQRGVFSDGDRNARPARPLAAAGRAVFDKNTYSAKGYRKRNTLTEKTMPQMLQDQNDKRPNPSNRLSVAQDLGGREAARVGRVASAVSAPYALFYREEPDADARAALEEAADGAYYRGSASSYVDLNIGREPAPAAL